MPTEIELKLHLDAERQVALRRHPLLRQLKLGRSQTRIQKSVYFDTSDFRLRDCLAMLRVRHVGRRRIQTVKTAGTSSGGVSQRGEWEWEISGDQPEIALLAESPLAPLFADHSAQNALVPVFTTEVRRTIFLLGGDDWEAELALDTGQIVGPTGSLPLSEIEFELKKGAPSHLFALAIALQGTLPLRILTRSKSERGYALLENRPAQPAKAASPSLAADAFEGDALHLILRSCHDQLVRNHECFADTQDPEAIHQMRVALRRIGSAKGIFKHLLDDPQTAALKAELRWLNGALGAARDRDVFIGDILEPVAGIFEGEPGFARLLESFRAEREQAYRAAAEALSSARAGRLLLNLGQWIETGDWRSPEDPERAERLARPARDLAEAILAKRHRRIAKAMRHIADIDVESRHLTRIEIKKLRYGVEFFASLFPHRKSAKLNKALAVMQDRLGGLNDIAVAGRLLHEHGRTDADLLWAAGLTAGWHQGRVAGLLEKLDKDWDAYRRLPRFWKA